MKEVFEQVLKAWNSLTMKQQFSLGASALLTVIAMGSIVWWAGQPSWSVLYTGLEPKDAQSVIEELQAQNVPYQIDSGGGAIRVPVEQVDSLRMDLANKGLPESGRFGFMEMFANDTVAQSNRTQAIRYQKALEDELARTIESLSEVSSARVHLVLPGDRIFLDDEDVAKASVTLAIRGSRTLAPGQVQSIAFIVSGGVPDLLPENVSVVDTSGRVLWESGGEGGGVAATRQVEMRSEVENSYEQKVAQVLEPLIGSGRFVVKASVEMDFQKVVRHERQIDGDSGVVVREQKSKDQTSSGGAASGVPGTAANLPGAQGGRGAARGQNKKSSDQTSTFDYSTVERTVEEPMGRIKRLSVAVLVDHVTNGEGQDAEGSSVQTTARPPEELARIEEIIKAAVSFDEARGDIVTVQQGPFQVTEDPVLVREFDPRPWLPLVKYPALILLALLAFLLFYRPLLRTIRGAFEDARSGEEERRAQAELEDQRRLGAPSRVETLRQRLSALATEEPVGVAQTLRVWLNEEKP